MRRLKITHRTCYNFSGAVQLAPHRLLLRPREDHELHIESSSLHTSPPAIVNWQRDAYGNSVAMATFGLTTAQLVITSEVIVQHYDEAPFEFTVAEHAVAYPFTYEDDVYAVLQPFMLPQTITDTLALRAWIERFWRRGELIQTYTLLLRMCMGIHEGFRYQVREEPGVQTASETLQRGSGSCRDFANLFMEATRALSLAARFVSGYLHAPAADANYGATHAWVEVYLPGAGWKGFDPTLGEVASSKHIAVAVARSPESVSPVAGSYFGTPGAALYVSVSVTAL